MRLVLFTSNALRHKYFANTLAQEADAALVISECSAHDSIISAGNVGSSIEEHFFLRYQTEKEFFEGNDTFRCPVVPLAYKEANLDYTYQLVKGFKPDLMLCFGASIIQEPLLSLLPSGNFINLHLGVSPYYRGAGTNFWPFVNKELEYVGSTIMYIDPGIDTGDIIAHVRPLFMQGDNVHRVGCRVIKDSVETLKSVIQKVKTGTKINRVKQWPCPQVRVYRSKDFTEQVLSLYYENLKNGLIEDYLRSGPKDIQQLRWEHR